MNRRTFVLLSGAASGSLLVPPRASVASTSRTAPPLRTGRLAFEFDHRHRWSLWYRGEGAPVPLLPFAPVGVRLGDRLLTLEDLDDVAVQAGSPPVGESTVIRGRGAGLFVEATFLVKSAASAPRAFVTLRIYPDTTLPEVSGVAWTSFPIDQAVPGTGELVALVDESHPALVRVPASAPDFRSSGVVGLTRRTPAGAVRALAAVAAPGGPGVFRATAGTAGLSLDTLWTPARPVSTAGDAETVAFCYAPEDDALAALAGACAPAEGDRGLLAAQVPPAGVWLSGSFARGENLPDLIGRTVLALDPHAARFACFDSEDPGPRGHRWCTDLVHAAGLLAAGPITPFAPPADAPPEWTGGGPTLDPAHPDVRRYLRERGREAAQDWGYDALILRGLESVFDVPRPSGGVTHLEALRAGLAALHAGAEATTLWSASLVPQTGTLNVVRVGEAPVRGWSGAAAAAVVSGLRSYYNRAWWLSDPGPVTLGDPLTFAEARTRLALTALTGGATLLTADVLDVPDLQLELVRRILPPAPVAGRPVGLAAGTGPAGAAPVLRLGRVALSLGSWRFHAGAGLAFAREDYDDGEWEPISAPGRWADAGHAGYAGEAWYRARFTAPATPPPGETPILALGAIADTDQTFVNGVLVGETGTLGLGTAADAAVSRRYPVPTGAIRWGSENVVAVRVRGGRSGGFWSGPVAAPASLWVAGAGDWWTVLIVNWENHPVQRDVRLAALGVPAGAYHLYDVWAGAPRAAGDPIPVSLDPHDSLVLGLRARAGHPQVMGTTRHLVQGVVDLRDESWDARAQTLSGRAVSLDGRPYQVTIATGGWSPGAAGGERPGRVRVLDSEHVMLDWPGGERGDFSWELSFERARRTRRARPR